MKHLKLFESFNDIKVEIKDILAYLSDDSFEISITSDIKKSSAIKDKFGDPYQTEYLTILIDKLSHQGQYSSRGAPFNLNDIKNDISNLISMLGDRYKLYSITTPTPKGVHAELMCTNLTNPWDEIKDELKTDIRFLKLKFTEI